MPESEGQQALAWLVEHGHVTQEQAATALVCERASAEPNLSDPDETVTS